MRTCAVLLFCVVVVGTIGIGSHLLAKNIELGPLRKDEGAPLTQQKVNAVLEQAAALRLDVPSVRIAVESDELTALRAELTGLRDRVKELEALRPTTRGELAVILGVKEADLSHLLDRSELLPNALALAEAVQRSGAQSVYDALQAEALLYRNSAEFKTKNPPPELTAERMMWHSSQWVPFYSNAVARTCNKLYELNLPSQLIESFRNRLNEGI